MKRLRFGADALCSLSQGPQQATVVMLVCGVFRLNIMGRKTRVGASPNFNRKLNSAYCTDKLTDSNQPMMTSLLIFFVLTCPTLVFLYCSTHDYCTTKLLKMRSVAFVLLFTSHSDDRNLATHQLTQKEPCWGDARLSRSVTISYSAFVQRKQLTDPQLCYALSKVPRGPTLRFLLDKSYSIASARSRSRSLLLTIRNANAAENPLRCGRHGLISFASGCHGDPDTPESGYCRRQ
jgi:hypothetical protein